MDMKKILWMLFFICTAPQTVFSSVDDYRVIVNTGELKANGPFAAFYNSRIFIGKNPPFYISNASNVQAFESADGTLYYVEGTLAPEALVKAKKGFITKSAVLVDDNFLGLINHEHADGEKVAQISSYLGAEQKNIELETRIQDGQKIIRVRSLQRAQSAAWPQDPALLKSVPAVVISSKNTHVVLLARSADAWKNDKLAVISKKAGLPDLSRPYETRDFNSLLGGMMVKASGADVAIYESEQNITPIYGPISSEIAIALLDRKGVMSVATISGKQLKRLIGLNAQNLFEKKLSFFNVDEKAKTIHGISINEDTQYKVAMSEVALLQGFNVARLGGLNDEYDVRAPFVELIHGRHDNLLFVGGIKKIPVSDTLDAFNKSLKNLHIQAPMAKLIEEQLDTSSAAELTKYVNMSQGELRPTIHFVINYIDGGYSRNDVNPVFKDYLQKKDGAYLPMSRAGVPPYAHIILLSKMNMMFDMPDFIATLGNSTKYMHYEFDKKPIRDKTSFNLDFRLPWERSVFRGKDVVFSPVLKILYDTKLAPIPGLSSKSSDEWKAANLSRIHRVDTLLGFNMNDKKLGISLDFGPFMVADLTQKSIHDALNFGPGFNFDGRWSLFGPLEFLTTMSGYYLFPLPKNKALNKTALALEGTSWLRFARYYNFSMSLMSDFLIATLQQKPRELAISHIFGVTISYGNVLRLLN